MGLSADEEAVQLLCYSYENNLLALKQALQLLDLLYPDHKLTYNRVKSAVEQSSVFTLSNGLMHCYQAKQTAQNGFCVVYKLKMCNLSFYCVLYSVNCSRC